MVKNMESHREANHNTFAGVKMITPKERRESWSPPKDHSNNPIPKGRR
jgi:hypothetical protein